MAAPLRPTAAAAAFQAADPAGSRVCIPLSSLKKGNPEPPPTPRERERSDCAAGIPRFPVFKPDFRNIQ
jgi:hypothetical protein